MADAGDRDGGRQADRQGNDRRRTYTFILSDTGQLQGYKARKMEGVLKPNSARLVFQEAIGIDRRMQISRTGDQVNIPVLL